MRITGCCSHAFANRTRIDQTPNRDRGSGFVTSEQERQLAEFAATLEHDDLPKTVREHVGLVIADTVAAIIGGSTEPPVVNLATVESESAPGDASILGTDRSASVGHAALVNATAGTSLELDEGHKYAAGHPAIHGLPATLAEAEVGDVSSESFVTAFVASYEVGTRVARACQPLADDYHMHGLWGAVGVAAGVARSRGFSVDETLEALRIAPNHALHTHFATATEGKTVRNTYAGMSNLSGILVANQVRAGFTGLESGLKRHLSRTSEATIDASRLTADLGDTWEVTRGYFKQHAACRYTHATLDAIATIQATHDLKPEDVKSVKVESYDAAARLTPTRPRNPLEAKFSIPFAVATRLLHKHSRKPAFTDSAITDEAIELAERVTVETADDIDQRVPDQRGARVIVTLADGSEVEREVEQAHGGTDDPFTEEELREKFHSLTVPVLGDQRATALWEAARSPTANSVRELCRLAIPDQ